MHRKRFNPGRPFGTWARRIAPQSQSDRGYRHRDKGCAGDGWRRNLLCPIGGPGDRASVGGADLLGVVRRSLSVTHGRGFWACISPALETFAAPCSFRPAEQGVHLGCFRSLPEAGFGLFSFAWRLHLGLLGRLDGSPDPFNCDLSTRELFDRRDARQSVPEGDQPLQRPRTRYRFPFFPARDHIRSLETVCRGFHYDPVPCEMEWHPVLLLLAVATCAATPSIAPRAPQ